MSTGGGGAGKGSCVSLEQLECLISTYTPRMHSMMLCHVNDMHSMKKKHAENGNEYMHE